MIKILESEDDKIINYYRSLFNMNEDWGTDLSGNALRLILPSNKKDSETLNSKIENSKYFVKWYKGEKGKIRRGMYRSFRTLDVYRWKIADDRINS